jgi:hypothetical protein
MSGSFKDKEQARNEFIEFLMKKPTRYHLTLSFSESTNEIMCIELLNRFVKQFNLYILKKRFTKNDQKIPGFVIKEPTRSLNTHHFHIFIFDAENKLPHFERLEEIIKKKTKSTNRYLNADRYKIKDFCLQNYYEQVKKDNPEEEKSSLEKYLTKNFECYDMSLSDIFSSFCPLDAESISFP